MAGIKNRGSQRHRVKTKFRRKKYNLELTISEGTGYFQKNSEIV